MAWRFKQKASQIEFGQVWRQFGSGANVWQIKQAFGKARLKKSKRQT
ncbi:MAG: hypothetical protein JNL02_00780 [Saprospiraceae bacterium]|nr:hypothetical protein [Saprospiraceae bacterium]